MRTLLLPLLMLVSSLVFGQTAIEDVVYLKNGGVIRGKIQPPSPLPAENGMKQKGEQNLTSDRVRIELLGGSIFVFEPAEIDSVKRENVFKNKLKEINKNYFRRDRGFRNMTEFGIIYGTNIKQDNADPYYYYNNQPTDDFGISLHTVNGYQVWPYLYAGVGVGIDRFVSYKQTFSPFYVRVASEFLKKKVTPYVFCDAGYAVMWKQKSTDYMSYKNKGGVYVECGGGVRIYTRSRASVILSVAYKRNQSETQWWYTQYDPGTVYNIQRTYQRLTVNVGVTF